MAAIDDDVDFYDVLGITRSSTADDVKKAYKKQALRWHPDKNPMDKESAEVMFRMVSEAYEVLSDEKKRTLYDRYGMEGVRKGGAEAEDDGFYHEGFHFHNPMELFASIFGNDPFMYGTNAFHRPQARQSRPQAQPGSLFDNMFGNDPLFTGSFGGGGMMGNSMMGSSMMGSSMMGSSMMGSSMMSGFGNFGTIGGFTDVGAMNGMGGGSFASSSSSTVTSGGKTVTERTEIVGGKKTTVRYENGVEVSRKEEILPQLGSGSQQAGLTGDYFLQNGPSRAPQQRTDTQYRTNSRSKTTAESRARKKAPSYGSSVASSAPSEPGCCGGCGCEYVPPTFNFDRKKPSFSTNQPAWASDNDVHNGHRRRSSATSQTSSQPPRKAGRSNVQQTSAQHHY
eukprot:Clim_evm21s172 gene=Clim_evmTU21s172